MAVRDFRGAFDDPALAPFDRVIAFGTRAVTAYDIDPTTFTASLIAPYDGVVLEESPPAEPPPITCGPVEFTWTTDFEAAPLDVDACGIPSSFQIGTPCYELEGGGGPAPCNDPPVVTWVSPPLGQAVHRYNPVVFTVTNDCDLRLRRVLIRVTYLERVDWEWLHDGTRFAPGYQGPINARVDIDQGGGVTGYQYTVLRDGGWPARPQFTVYAVNVVGREA